MPEGTVSANACQNHEIIYAVPDSSALAGGGRLSLPKAAGPHFLPGDSGIL